MQHLAQNKSHPRINFTISKNSYLTDRSELIVISSPFISIKIVSVLLSCFYFVNICIKKHMSPFFGKPSHLSFFQKNSQFNLWFIFSFLEFYLAIDSSREKSQLESNADNSACDAKKSQVGACAISSTWILITFIFFIKPTSS